MPTQKTVTVWRFDELSDKAKARALNDWNSKRDEVFWSDEIIESLKAVFKHTQGVRLKDWELGICSRSFVKIAFDQEEAETLTGPRALAWLENNLLAGLRIPYRGNERWSVSKYGASYRAGMIKPCPLTGVCFDEMFLDSLIESVKKGEELREAFEGLAGVAEKMLNDENDAQNSEEYFADHCDANGYEFDENGKMI